jgi:hypothetical protein
MGSRGTAIWIFGLFLMILASTEAEGARHRISAGLDWMIGERIGMEYSLSDDVGIEGHVGMSLMGIMTADLMASFRLFSWDSRFQLDLVAGIPNFGWPTSWNAFMVSFGGGARVGFKIGHNLCLFIRLGLGFPVFYEHGKDVIRGMKIWPDFVVGFSVPVPGF